jgi:hypothetical protein
LATRDGGIVLELEPADKIVKSIRSERKDVFLVAFKATAGVSVEECYARGLHLLKSASANLVLANDVRNHHNIVVVPEEFPYVEKSRKHAVRTLCEMIRDRTRLHFVRTHVRDETPADPLALERAGAIPQNFVPVLRHLIERGAFKPFRGRTSGHFGCRVLDPSLGYQRISSVRKVDHNRVLQDGMAKIYGIEDGKIVAGGARPSVGEHTQGEIYDTLGDQVHSIVHVHCPLREGANGIATASQRPFECGSVECGKNTAENLAEVEPGVFVVHLEGHGPNVAYRKDVPPERVILLIEKYFDLDDKTGGVLTDHAAE